MCALAKAMQRPSSTHLSLTLQAEARSPEDPKMIHQFYLIQAYWVLKLESFQIKDRKVPKSTVSWSCLICTKTSLIQIFPLQPPSRQPPPPGWWYLTSYWWVTLSRGWNGEGESGKLWRILQSRNLSLDLSSYPLFQIELISLASCPILPVLGC